MARPRPAGSGAGTLPNTSLIAFDRREHARTAQVADAIGCELTPVAPITSGVACYELRAHTRPQLVALRCLTHNPAHETHM